MTAWRAALLLVVAGVVAGRKAVMAMGVPSVTTHEGKQS